MAEAKKRIEPKITKGPDGTILKTYADGVVEQVFPNPDGTTNPAFTRMHYPLFFSEDGTPVGKSPFTAKDPQLNEKQRRRFSAGTYRDAFSIPEKPSEPEE